MRYLRFVRQYLLGPEDLEQFDHSCLRDEVHADHIEDVLVEAVDGQFEGERLVDEAFELQNIEEFGLTDAFPHPAIAHRLDLRVLCLQFERLDETGAVRGIVQHVVAEIALDVPP